MCPNADSLPTDPSQMVAIETTPRVGRPATAVNGVNGVNGHATRAAQPQRNPYAPRASDYQNNISNFSIIESTLRGSSFSLRSTRPSLLNDIDLVCSSRRRAVRECVL